MKKIKKGTFVFEKNSILSAGFFVSAKKKLRRGFFGYGATSETEIIIKDLWSGKDTGFMSLDSTDELSTDKNVFKKHVLSLIETAKESVTENSHLLSSSMKRKITLYERNKQKPKTDNEKIQTLANDLDFYEKILEDLIAIKNVA